MTETVLEENDLPEVPRKPLRLEWLLPVFYRPGKTLRAVVESETSNWLAPLLLLTLLAIVYILVAGPLRAQQIQSQPIEPPSDFQYWSPDTQQKYMEANQPNTSPLMIYGLPALGALLGVWGGWFILAAILHLGLTLSGGRGSRIADFNLTAWSSMPFAIRYLVQIIALLSTHQLISAPGLSGFFASDVSGFLAYLAGMAAFFDLYLIWQIVLLTVGATLGARLPTAKAAVVVVVSIIVLLALQALPGFLMAQLGALSVQRPFFF